MRTGYRKVNTLCWSCAKNAGRCLWSSKLKPVPGWTAIRRDIQVSNGTTESYLVKACPEYEREYGRCWK